uniref:Uncharacterized protein n=1 Tax=Hippocampus comes TaxID=109280 RepID=A0A3Q2YIT3_HIPCM
MCIQSQIHLDSHPYPCLYSQLNPVFHSHLYPCLTTHWYAHFSNQIRYIWIHMCIQSQIHLDSHPYPCLYSQLNPVFHSHLYPCLTTHWYAHFSNQIRLISELKSVSISIFTTKSTFSFTSVSMFESKSDSTWSFTYSTQANLY